MINAQNTKDIWLLGQATAATNAATTASFDRLGFNYATLTVTLPPATATNSSAKLITLSLLEGDTTSSYATVSGFQGTTNSTAAATEFVLPVQNNTSVGAIHKFYLNLTARKRYLKLSVTPPASHTILASSVTLSRAETAPDTDTERGVAVSVIG